MKNKIKKFIVDPKARFDYLEEHGLYNWMSDEKFLNRKWKLIIGDRLNLDNPRSFNEKLQWLKLHDRKDIYTKMVDKYEAKKYVAGIIGENYIIPTIGVYDRFDDIDFDELPNRFVIKCTHNSGGLVIVKDKRKMNIKEARRRINKSLKREYYYHGREWPYKNVKPRVIIEKYMSGFDGSDILDYKFFCFNGEPEIILVCSDRFSNDGLKETWFDKKFNKLDLVEGGHENDNNLKKPKELLKMLEVSRELSKGFPFIRIDLYVVKGKVYFGEITFFPASGFERFDPREWDIKLGNMIDLNLVGDNN
ncbi:glycosyl transferase [Candidatus Saccharibacteria bacterium]|nr:glycosyl transferase [Candidatus Saccharibacteria bacterium]